MARALLIVTLGLAACAGTPEEQGVEAPRGPEEPAREVVRAGAVRRDVDEVVAGYRQLVLERVAANIAALEEEIERLPDQRRERGLAFTREMQARLEEDLATFIASIDFDALAVELFAPLFEERLSPQELDGLLAFYRSPAGRAWVRERTGLAEAATQALAARMEPTMETFMRQWFDEELGRLRQAVESPESK